MSPDLSVTIGALTLPNPLIAASGCFGYGVEYQQVVDLSSSAAWSRRGLRRRRASPTRMSKRPQG